MGFHTSAPVAFLMTFFNVRLGLWLRSPKAGPGKQLSRWGLWYLLKELFATADVNDRCIYLSDGGHFENLGVYELIRRRCRYILACDAEEDPNLVLEGLGNLVRKARIDFGAEIVIDTSQIRQRDENARSRAHCAVGRIHYDGNPNEAEAGYLIYLKASLTGDEVSDVLQYKAQHAAFPHESTGDQFFSESQFESYRALGDHIVEKAFARQKIPARRGELESLMQAMSEDWPFPAGSPRSTSLTMPSNSTVCGTRSEKIPTWPTWILSCSPTGRRRERIRTTSVSEASAEVCTWVRRFSS
jgi:hypothetical protein